MQFFLNAVAWLLDPANYRPGLQTPLPIQDRIVEHLLYTFISVAIAALIALPLGLYIGHTGRGRGFVIAFSGGMRALPTLGLLGTLFVVIGLTVPFTQTAFFASIIAFVVLAIPSILAGAYAGVESVDPETVDAARSIGMTELQIVWKVEIPLSLPLIIGGIRASVLQVIATVVIASYVSLGGLGAIISTGISLNDNDLILGGALLVTVLALVIDGLFALAQRLTRRGHEAPTRRRRTHVRTLPSRRRAVTVSTVDERDH
ncbi:osmoprotectant transport system permease protein [Curtobacterium sp. PhB130]|uniref:ABC transporter permease n=1 Tax=unclassified Curtobacterium TaxID=257496 RepID=UPI000F4CF645|nr:MULTISPECIES: ABC transporter permease [unclassified Curtobacterium]ROP64876.1 osmoprotectant transport system permease protein [Curtobacterium sp. ZW137]ROS75157.1 osmoprotectant transport system permease protein [Curtobacterium sp. PhB130]